MNKQGLNLANFSLTVKQNLNSHKNFLSVGQ